MVTILVVISIIIVVAAIVLNFDRPWKKKTWTEQSSGQKVVSALKSKINKSLEDLANNIRTPDVIEQEINSELDKYYIAKSIEAKSILKTYRNAMDTCQKSQRLLENNKSQMNSRLDELKKRYAEAEDDKKGQILSIAEAAMASLKNIKKSIEDISKRLDEIKTKKACIEDQIELFVASFNIKKVEILNHVATLKTTAITNPNFHGSFNIGALVDDLEMAINERIDNNRVENIFNGSNSENITSVSNIEIDEDTKKETFEFLTK